jgi:hypothetical protein
MGGMSSSYSGSYDWDRSERVTKKSAKSYAKKDKRSYTGGSSKGIPSPKGKEIQTNSQLVEILVVDVTGSMGEWPGLIFEKIPTLYNEANVALQGLDIDGLAKGQEPQNLLEMAVIAVGDAFTDRCPIQVVDFSKGTDLVKGINKIFPEGNGGGFGCESYELVAYFLAKHCKTPKVPKGAKPVLIWACDEDFYAKIRKDQVKRYIGDNIGQNMDADAVMKQLANRFDMYVLRPEPEGDCDVYRGAHKHWESLLGPQRVMRMEDASRLVDCVIGISAYAANNFQVGEDLLKRRQTPTQVKQVLRTLHPLLEEESKPPSKEGKK